MKSRYSRWRSGNLFFILALFIALAALGGCTDLFNAIMDNPAPTGVSASDGDHTDSIEVSWGAPNLSSDKWKDYRVLRYDISWNGPSSGSDTTNGTSYSIAVSTQDRARLFTVTVESILVVPGGGTESGGTSSDDGFAILTEDLLWRDGGQAYGITGADMWYVTMLQKGFIYSFNFASGQTGSMEFYDYKSLSPQRGSTGVGQSPAWTCDQSGAGYKFYVHVKPIAPGATFTATYGF
jgi:hypothetical protein